MKSSATKPLLALFIEHIDIMKREMRQRKALTKLQNVKSTRISSAHLKSSALNRLVSIGDFKPQDKRSLLRNFFSDERV